VPDRRTFLAGAAASGLALASGGLIQALRSRSALDYDGLQTRGPDIAPITPNDEFYVVTKNLVDPRVAKDRWRLEVRGLVDRERTYRFEELAALGPVTQETTLECISNPIGGGLMSNAEWRGVRLRTLLEEARPRENARWVLFHAADGYTHSTPLEKALEESKLLAYEMNGEPLPDRHGFPVRLLHPGGYGELSVKWIDRIEVGSEQVEGYYERQGWRAQRVHTMSRIDAPKKNETLPRAPTIAVNGVAFAGDRGIGSVEVSTDDGRTWADARLDYARSPLAWALWSFTWEAPAPGEHTLVVRATDGTGELQSDKREGIAPDGASGLHRKKVRVEA
jgi:DMSO/TMAO reductase YedYZ molybdopterin-dependent catalytic subunit